MPRFSILLPPSEGKCPGGNPFAPDMFDYRSSSTFNYFNDLNPERRKLITALQEIIEAGRDLETVFGVKGETLEQAIAANMTIFDAPLMSAMQRYSPGTMYKSMDFAGLPTGAQRRLLENGIIVSGLFGLLRPDDLIPDYRLRIDAVLPEMGRVSRYWRPYISPLLNEAVKGHIVWNLLPSSHKEAWDDEHTYEQMIELRFFEEENGERKAITHGVKPLRGQLVNVIVREAIERMEDLKDWEHPAGYVYDDSESSWDETTRTGVVAMVRRA
ncbi:MAG: peroxide stress protein YaaA [Rhodothermales bacterium]